MATRSDVERFAQANRDIRTLILRDLEAFWVGLDVTDPLRVRSALEEFLPELVAAYGEVAVAVAADFYDDLRDAAGVRGVFAAIPADPVDAERVRAAARWAITPLFDGKPDPVAALGRLGQVADTYALQPGRDTIATSTARDPAGARWARVPVGKTCAFCLMTASRGAVYRSAETAGRGRKYHSHCDCTPTPIWPEDEYPAGYDPDALYETYRAAADAAKSGSAKAVLSELRQQQDTN